MKEHANLYAKFLHCQQDMLPSLEKTTGCRRNFAYRDAEGYTREPMVKVDRDVSDAIENLNSVVKFTRDNCEQKSLRDG